MPQIVYYVAASVDGFIASTGGGLEWLAPFESSDEDYGYQAFYRSVEAVLLGSHTYEQALGFGEWPYQDKPVFVSSSRALAPVAGNVVVTSESPEAVAGRLDAAGIGRAWLVGGGLLAGSFHRAGLISEFVISTIPVLLGDGVPILGGRGRMERLELLSTRRYPDGVLQQVYRAESDPRPTGADDV